jgi:tetratricopeptide (TPR) repeat protein
MKPVDVLCGELERLFSLEELTTLAERFLGVAASEIGGTTARASFAHALAEHCVSADLVGALGEVVVHARRDVDARLREVFAELDGPAARPPYVEGDRVGDFLLGPVLGRGDLGVVHRAERTGGTGADAGVVLKILHRDVSRDPSRLHRFLAATRLVGALDHPGLPARVEAAEVAPRVFGVAYAHVEARTLASIQRRGRPLPSSELRPILRQVLDALAAIHDDRLVHGNLKPENVLLTSASSGDQGKGSSGPGILLVDAAGDRLRRTRRGPNGAKVRRGLAPELVSGVRDHADARSDVYAFGALFYELATGWPVFDEEDTAVLAELHQVPERPSRRAPQGTVSEEVDALILGLLEKDPAKRPEDARAVLAAFDALGRRSASIRAAGGIGDARIEELRQALIESPRSEEIALTLANAALQGADPAKVADAFVAASSAIRDAEANARAAKKILLGRAARTLEAARDRSRAEAVYARILELDPSDEMARGALEDIRRALGKYEDLVEMLLARADASSSKIERGKALAEIGRLYATELDDPEQAAVAFVRALCEDPENDVHAAEVERLLGAKKSAWTEALDTMRQALPGFDAPALRGALLLRIAAWSETKLERSDLAEAAYREILAFDPKNNAAAERTTELYRRAERWPDMVRMLLARAEIATSAPAARELRTTAAEVLDARGNDAKRARELLRQVTSEDPAHVRATEAIARIAERAGDYELLAATFATHAEALSNAARASVLLRLAAVQEEQLADLPGATRSLETALALEPKQLVALQRLERLYSRGGQLAEALPLIQRQIELAPTPRQKLELHLRVAAIQDEELADHRGAARELEAALAIDPAHDGAQTALARHYRALEDWERAALVYEKHASVTTDEGKRIELLLAQGRTLLEELGAPERASRVYERILTIDEAHAGALEALARIREMTGDAQAALKAIEALARKADTPEAKAEHWGRAARLLEERSDIDAAIERYKLALESKPRDSALTSALRRLYAARSDWRGTADLVEREIGSSDEGDPAVRARLWAELATVRHVHLGDRKHAEIAAKKALALDPENIPAALVLADQAWSDGRTKEARAIYDHLVDAPRGVLAGDDAIRVLLRFLEASRDEEEGVESPSASTASTPTASTVDIPARRRMAATRLGALAADDPDALERAAGALLAVGAPESAFQLFDKLIERHGASLSPERRRKALLQQGESARRSGKLAEAVAPLRLAVAEDAGPEAAHALARVYDELGDLRSAIEVREKRVENAKGEERFELFLAIGDRSGKLGDRVAATAAYGHALEERPADRNLLTKLMQLYSDTEDWEKVCDVVLRLAGFVEDPRQRAKYMFAAATIASEHLADSGRAIEYYERVLELEETSEKALGEVIALYRKRKEYAPIARLLEAQLDRAKVAGDKDRIVRFLDELGDLYRTSLDDPDLAAEAYEAAEAFASSDARLEKLGAIYADNPAAYTDRALAIQATLLRRDPYRIESYKLLRQLYTTAKRADSAWCLCQALSVLHLADEEEEEFYRAHRSPGAAHATAEAAPAPGGVARGLGRSPMLDEAAWDRLVHWDLDPLLTRIFALIQPTIVRARTEPLEAHGYEPGNAIDAARHPDAGPQMLHYAARVLALPPPVVFAGLPAASEGADDPFAILHARPPAILLRREGDEPIGDFERPRQALAFRAGRLLTSFRPGFYVRHLVPTGTGLRAWLFAAIRLSVPQFPVTTELLGQVGDAMREMQADFRGVDKERLASAVSKLLQEGGALDLKKWVAAIDLSGDRAGLLLADDLQTTTEAIRATEAESSVAVKERMKDIVLFSVSEDYFALRDSLGMSVDIPRSRR